MKNLYFVELTDTFSGEANYSFVNRFVISANNVRGAVNKFSRLSGMKWHNTHGNRYDSKSGLTCYFIDDYDAELHTDYSFSIDER